MGDKPKGPKLHVRDVFDPARTLALIVDEDTPFEEVIRRFAERTDLRGIFVVDAKRRLTGVITRTDLLSWASLVFRSPGPPSRVGWGRLFRLARATTAKEACQPHSHLSRVSPDDPLDEALARMVAHKLIDLPVVDADGRILGDLRLTELLVKALDVAERGQGGRARG